MNDLCESGGKTRLIFHVKIPTLAIISAVQLVLKLWRRRIPFICELNETEAPTSPEIYRHHELALKERELFKNEHLDLGDVSSTCPKIKKIVVDCFERVKSALSRWLMYHTEHISSVYYGNRTWALEWFDEIIWYPDGTIDYNSTAKNLLRCDKLSRVEKCIVACGFCFEEEIYRVLPSDATNELYDEGIFSLSPIMHYWKCHRTGKSNGIFSRRCSFVGNHMVDETLRNWPAVEYFWSRLDHKDQTDRATDIMRIREFTHIKGLLPKLDESQLQHVLRRSAVDIVVGFAKKPEYFYYAKQTLPRLKNVISADTFLYILLTLLNIELEYKPNCIPGLMREMWSVASKRCRDFALDRLDNILHGMYENFNSQIENLSGNVEFIIELLSGTEARFREQLWQDNWQLLIIGVHPDRINELMYLCLGGQKEVDEFKDQHMSKYPSIQSYCEKLIRGGYIVELNMFLKLYSKPETVRDLKEQILQSENFHGTKLRIQSCHDNHLIDVSFPDMRQWKSYNYMNETIISISFFQYLANLLHSDHLRAIKELVDLLPVSEQHLSEIKERLVKLSLLNMIRDVCHGYDVGEWNEFLEWCLGDAEKISEFKRSLSIDGIFYNVFDLCAKHCDQEVMDLLHCDLRHRRGIVDKRIATEDVIKSHRDYLMGKLKPIDAFLRWYFADQEVVEEFKLLKAYGVGQKRIFETLAQIENKCVLDIVIGGLVKGDAKRIQELKRYSEIYSQCMNDSVKERSSG